MKYARERRFLENLNIASIYFDEFLTFNVLNDIEKKIMYYVFRKRRSIRNIANLGLLPYEKTRLYEIYNGGILKLKKWLKTTEKYQYKRLYEIIV